jgi:general secretion pathway protein L
MTHSLREMLQAVRAFYASWLSALSAAIAGPRSAMPPWRILLMRGENGLEIVENSGGKAVSLAKVRTPDGGPLPPSADAALRAAMRSSSPIVLRLSPEEVVERTLQIPQGAIDVIEPVLRNQMNRIVPWPLEETCFGFTVAGANPNSAEQLDVRLAATTRGVLDSALAEARGLGLSPTAVDAAPREAMGAGILLLSLTPDPRLRLASLLHTSLAIVLALCIAIGGAGFYQLWRAQGERRDVDARIAAARTRIAEAGLQNAQGKRLREVTDALIQRKTAEPPVVSLIEGLSRALPDSAFLTELEIRKGAARMVGKSNEAAALIAAIESAPQFEQVGFAAPTTRDASETMESFTITARITGAASTQESDDGGR